MSRSKRATYLILGSVIVAAALGGLYSINAAAVFTEVGRERVVDFSASFPMNNVTIARGESMTIPVDIYSAKDKAKDFKIYISEPEHPTSIIEQIREAKISQGISANFDRTQLRLEAADGNGIEKRANLPLSISVDQSATEGMHVLAVTLVDQEGSFMTTYLRVNVVG